MPSSIYFADAMKTGRFLMRKGTIYARGHGGRRAPLTLYALVALVLCSRRCRRRRSRGRSPLRRV
jgi:hypothetical protein